MLNDTPAEVKVSQNLLRRLNLSYAHIGNNLLSGCIEVLNEQAAINANILILNLISAGHINLQETQVLLSREDLESLSRERRCHNNLQEDWLHTESDLCSNLTIQSYDTTEDTLCISLVCACPSLQCILTDCCTARVHVLQSYAEWLVELANDIQRCICVLNVVVRKFLAIQLLSVCQREVSGRVVAVEGCRLVRVLTITQRLLNIELEEQLLWQASLLAHICSDARVVLCSVSISLSRQLQTSSLLSIALSLNLIENLCIVCRVADYGYILVVLSSRTQHRRTANIDILDSLSHLNTLLSDSLTEWIEVYANHIDKLDTILAQRLQVALQIATSQQTAVYLRVQSLNSTVANLRKTCNLADTDSLHTILLQQALCTACCYNLPAKRLQTAYKLNQTGLVAYTY